MIKPEWNFDLHTQDPYAAGNFSWYFGPTDVKRGGFVSNYTERTYYPNMCRDEKNILQGKFKPFLFPRVHVVTDGTCGSACALFVAQIQTHRALFTNQSFDIISYCGLQNSDQNGVNHTGFTPMDTSSFAGGNVLDTLGLAQMSSRDEFENPRLPAQFPSSAVARFNFREYYTSVGAPTPREFIRLPADRHLSGFCDALWSDDIRKPFGNRAVYELYFAILDR